MFVFLPSFGHDLSEYPDRVVVAHVLKVHIVHLVGEIRSIDLDQSN